MKTIHLLTSIFIFTISNGFAEESTYPQAKVSFDDYKHLVAEVEDYREKRLIDLPTFLEMSKKDNVVILDTRSKFRYDRIHVKGAIHLNFSDFTQTNLAALIPSPDTTILIYCNNNFQGNQVDFATKSFSPAPLRMLVDGEGKLIPAPQVENTPHHPVCRTGKAPDDGPKYSHLSQPLWLWIPECLRVARVGERGGPPHYV